MVFTRRSDSEVEHSGFGEGIVEADGKETFGLFWKSRSDVTFLFMMALHLDHLEVFRVLLIDIFGYSNTTDFLSKYYTQCVLD